MDYEGLDSSYGQLGDKIMKPHAGEGKRNWDGMSVPMEMGTVLQNPVNNCQIQSEC